MGFPARRASARPKEKVSRPSFASARKTQQKYGPSFVCLRRVTPAATFGPKAMFPESKNQSRAAGPTQESASSDGPESSLAAAVRAVAAQTAAGTDAAALMAALAATSFQSPRDPGGLAATEAQSISPPLTART
eukprot:3855054-Pyramimonas_sp.AAC.2